MMTNPNYLYEFDMTSEQLEEIEKMVEQRILDESLTKRTKRTEQSIRWLYSSFWRSRIESRFPMREWFDRRCARARDEVGKPTITFRYFEKLIRRGEQLYYRGGK